MVDTPQAPPGEPSGGLRCPPWIGIAVHFQRNPHVAQFIAQMRKIKSVRMASGTRHLLEITKRNRDIMAAVGVPLPE